MSIAAQQQATLLFAGDAMMHQGQIDAAKRQGGVYDYSDCFAAVAPFVSQADYAVVNLETPLGGAPYSGYPCFCAPDSYATALKDAGFDLFLTANNHTLDRHDRGLKRTIQELDRQGIAHIGTYRDQAQRDSLLPKIVNVNGFKIGMLNYTYGTNGIEIQGDCVVDYINREKMARDIAQAREKGAELVCVNVHWGDEYKLLPNSSQRALAKFLLSQGVEMIIGGHPHVIQPMEMITDENTGKRSFLVYSLGNFISNMKTRDTRGGAMVEVKLRRDSVGVAYVADAGYRLVFTVPGRPAGTNVAAGVSGYSFTIHPVEHILESTSTTLPEAIMRQWLPAARAFTQSAESIYRVHNRL